MKGMWYPSDERELRAVIEKFINVKQIPVKEEIHGLIVPHAGYVYSGSIVGTAFALLKNKKVERVVVLGPSHYVGFYGVRTLHFINTPLGEVKITKNNFKNLDYEHSVENQIPFLQFLFPKIEVLPLVVGQINNEDAEKFANELSKEKAIFIFSSDLSHFLPYENASSIDKKTIGIIEKLDFSRVKEIDACGIFPLLIMMHLCKIKKWNPHLIEYKNSGDVTGEKSSVVGYAGFWF